MLKSSASYKSFAEVDRVYLPDKDPGRVLGVLGGVSHWGEILSTSVGAVLLTSGFVFNINYNVTLAIKLIGAVSLFVGLFKVLLRRRYFRRRNSVVIPTFANDVKRLNNSGSSSNIPVGLQVRFAQDTGEIDAITLFLHHVFNPGLKSFTGTSYAERRDLYRLWFANTPKTTFVGIWGRQPDRTEKLVGCSILLPLQSGSYTEYRNGAIKGFGFHTDSLDKTPPPTTSGQTDLGNNSRHLFWQTFYMWKLKHYGAELGPFLRDVALDHLFLVCGSKLGVTKVIAPRNTLNGQLNMKALGADELEESRGKFRLFELDFHATSAMRAEEVALLEHLKQMKKAKILKLNRAQYSD